MAIIGKDFKYKLIENFLSKDEIDLFYEYAKIRHLGNTNEFGILEIDKILTCDTSIYADPFFEALLKYKTKHLENETGLRLLPTYSYWRLYTHGAELTKHSDRDACEISVTVNIFGKEDWPIFMNNNPVIIKPGDACVYLGQEVDHYRKVFTGHHQVQVFLHYVNADGDKKEQHLDKRSNQSKRIQGV